MEYTFNSCSAIQEILEIRRKKFKLLSSQQPAIGPYTESDKSRSEVIFQEVIYCFPPKFAE